jgi:hypothetical protein
MAESPHQRIVFGCPVWMGQKGKGWVASRRAKMVYGRGEGDSNRNHRNAHPEVLWV